MKVPVNQVKRRKRAWYRKNYNWEQKHCISLCINLKTLQATGSLGDTLSPA